MKYIKYQLVVIGLILSVCMHAQIWRDHHHVVLSFAGSYAGYIHDYILIDEMHSSNWDVFLGYEYEHAHFIAQTGLGARYSMANIAMDDYKTSLFTYDTQGKYFEYVYNFTDRYDESQALTVNIPLLVGAKFSCAYFLAGIINNVSLWEDYSINTLVTCKGSYDRYMGDFSGMDNHAFYSNEPLKRSADFSAIRTSYQLYPYLELGVDVVNLAKHHRYSRQSNGLQIRIAAFTQFGSLNLYSHAAAEQPYVIDQNHPYDLSLIEVPAVCNNNYVAQSFMYDWSVGLRLSLLFDVSYGSRFCLTCDKN